jgi:DnaJ-class molecular chaperone
LKPSLYDDLDVPEDADAETIKRAHRKAVRNHHPDKGGNREQFEKVQHAYMVLSNPDRREKYDKTGSDEVEVDNELSESMTIIMAALDEAVVSIGANMWKRDLIAATRKLLHQQVSNIDQQIKNFEGTRDGLKELIKRIKYFGKGQNFISNAMVQRMDNLDQTQAQAEKDRARVERAIAFLDDYGFEFDQPQPMSAGSIWASSLSTNSTST